MICYDGTATPVVANIPAGVVSISSTAFNNNKVPNADDGWIYKRTNSGIDYSTIIGYAGAPKNNLTIPTSRGGVQLKALGPSALTYLGLTGTLKIPNTITKVLKYSVVTH